MRSTPPLLLFGAGPYARLLRRVAEDAGRTVAGFMVDAAYRDGEAFDGLPLRDWESILGSELGAFEFVVAMGYKSMRSRAAAAARIGDAGGTLATIVHPAAQVADSASIGCGSVLFAGAIVEHFAKIGENNILWSGSIICHDTILGHGNYLAPGVVVAGYCRLGARCFLGARATLIDGIEVGDDCLIAAGALLVQNAEALGFYAGTPARLRRRLAADVGVCIEPDREGIS